jgi:predicted small lipoprotein YifL
MKCNLIPRSHRCAVILLATVGLLPGCGQYGDLYLPEKKPPPQQPAQTADTPKNKDPQQTGD